MLLASLLTERARAQEGEARASKPDQPQATEVVVRAVRSAIPSGVSVSAREAEMQAGSLGDATRVVENMPGVARGGPTTSFVAWGSSEEESGVLLDGVPLPFLFHGSAVRGVVPSSALSSVRVIPGAFGAEYGRATGGLVILRSNVLRDEGPTLEVGADLIDVQGQINGEMSGRVFGSGTFRQSILAAWLPESELGESPFVIPDYRDGLVRARVQIDDESSLGLNYVGAEDWVTRSQPGFGGERFDERRARRFQRIYANFQREDAERRVIVTPFFGTNRDERAVGDADVISTSPARGAHGYRSAVDEVIYGLRATDTYRFAPIASMQFGIDVQGTASRIRREGTLTLPSREGDPYAFGVVPATDTTFDRYRTHILDGGLFSELLLALGPLTVTPSLRLNLSFIETSALRPVSGSVPPSGRTAPHVNVEPRIFARYALSREVALFGGAGTYSKLPTPADLSAVFGTPTLGPSRAIHGTFGLSSQIQGVFEVEVQGFAKELWDLGVRSSSLTPRVAEVLVPSGSGTVFGAQGLLRLRDARGWSGWLSWTISRSVRREVDGHERLFDFDQPQVVTFVLTRAFGAWVPSVRARYASGSPRTPVRGSYWNHSSGRYEPVFGAIHSTRLPGFFQLDIRLERHFRLGAHRRVTASIEAQNLTFRENAEEFLYSPSFEESGLLLGMPPLLNVGLRCEL